MRKNGYYWIKREPKEEPKIGYYCHGYWKLIGSDRDYTDYDFYQIYEEQIIQNI
jgi:hypothetical protein